MSATATVTDVLGGTARWCVVEGDCAAVTRSLPDARFDAIVTDPPSGIAFMGAAWDRDKGGRLQWAAWLAGILSDARRATRDGGRALVWSLPRTSHWTGCAVEDAGWSIETTVAHLFGTGWPKGKAQTKPAQETWWLARTGRSEALNIEACRVTAGGPSPSIARREIAARTGNTPSGKTGPTGWENRNSAEHYTAPREGELAGRYPPNLVISHADGCVCEGTRRVASASVQGATRGAAGFGGWRANERSAGYADPDGTESVDAWRCVEGCPVAELDRQSGVHHERAELRADGGASRFFPQFPADDPDAPWNKVLLPLDSGESEIRDIEWENADQSHCARTGVTSPERAISEGTSTDGCDSRTSSNGSATTDPSLPAIKSTTSTRTSKTTASRTSRSSTPQRTSDSTADACSETACGGSPAASVASSNPSPKASGTSASRDGRSTGAAASATSSAFAPTIISAASEPPSIFGYFPKPSRRERDSGGIPNIHSTVKSVALMRWLLRLVTKPGGVILDPFGGSGTTGVAALLEGRRVVLIEREPQYAAIARARCAAADGSEWAAPIVARPREVKPADARQPGLFDGRPL